MANADKKVGYKKPPKETQFEKGKSGNPNGRPKNTMKRTATGTIKDVLTEKVWIGEGKHRRHVTRYEYMITKLAYQGMQGDTKSIRMCIDLLDDAGYFKMSNEKINRGMLVVPGPVDPEEWEKAVGKAMAKARGEVFDDAPDFSSGKKKPRDEK